ncbi:UNVERIFIED_CONTAM: tc1a [Trichonephila clavipes]
MQRHNAPAPSIMVWGDIGFYSNTPLDNEQPHVARNVQEFFFTHQIELLTWPACSHDLSPIENVWPMLSQRLPTIHRINFGSMWKSHGYIQRLFDSIPRRLAAVIAKNGGYTYRFCHHSHVTRGCNFNRLIFVKHVICQINFAVISLVLLGVAFCVVSIIKYLIING